MSSTKRPRSAETTMGPPSTSKLGAGTGQALPHRPPTTAGRVSPTSTRLVPQAADHLLAVSQMPSQLDGLPPRSPAWPTHGATSGRSPQRVQPRFSAEPPLLDLATGSVFESPALMPANMALNLPTIDQLPGQMSGWARGDESAPRRDPRTRCIPLAQVCPIVD